MRIQVKYDILQPLLRSAKLTLDNHHPPVRVLLRYEKLPDYCYVYGLLGHQLKSRYIKSYDLEHNKLNYPYGLWLRAEDAKFFVPPVMLFTSSYLISPSLSTVDPILLSSGVEMISQK